MAEAEANVRHSGSGLFVRQHCLSFTSPKAPLLLTNCAAGSETRKRDDTAKINRAVTSC